MNINEYSQAYMTSYDFEKTLVNYRRKVVIEFLKLNSSASVLEVGCGLESAYFSYIETGESADTEWTIIEPSIEFFEKAQNDLPSNVHLINGFLENVKKSDLGRYDAIICAGLLHEVADPSHFLNSLKRFMSKLGC